jgi:hypothetical protein
MNPPSLCLASRNITCQHRSVLFIRASNEAVIRARRDISVLPTWLDPPSAAYSRAHFSARVSSRHNPPVDVLVPSSPIVMAGGKGMGGLVALLLLLSPLLFISLSIPAPSSSFSVSLSSSALSFSLSLVHLSASTYLSPSLFLPLSFHLPLSLSRTQSHLDPCPFH